MTEVALAPDHAAPAAAEPAPIAAVRVGERRGTIHSLQVLRFFAAALVVLSHIEDRLQGFSERYGVSVPPANVSGRIGVDIFFVISGFIMAYLALGKFGEKGAAKKFILDRIARIVPMYWAATCALIALNVFLSTAGDASRSEPMTIGHALKSLLFIPYLNFEGKHRPILGQGWTLDFEMMFYAMFALCLLFRRWRGLALLAGAFCLLYSASFLPRLPVPLGILSDPIIFEFLVGIGLALIRERLPRLVPVYGQVTVMLVVLAAYVMLFQREGSYLANIVIATLLVALCTLGTDLRSNTFVSRALVRFGGLSYSLYLTHGFVLLVVGIVWRKVFGAGWLPLYAVSILVLSMLLAHLSCTYVELPGTSLAKRWFERLLPRAARPRTTPEAPPS